MTQLKNTKTSNTTQLKDAKTSHDDSGSASGPGAGPDLVNAPAAAVKLQPWPSMILTTIQVTSSAYGSTSTAATADKNRSSSNSNISSYTGLLGGVLGGVERTLSRSKSKNHERRDRYPHLAANNTPQGRILQTQEVSIQVRDRDMDLSKTDIEQAV